MDPYSEILSGLRLKGAIFFRGEFSAPWFINAPTSPQLAAALGLQMTHVVNFHLLTEGEARVELPAGSTLELYGRRDRDLSSRRRALPDEHRRRLSRRRRGSGC